jgi:hypothetical protein
MRMLKTEKGCRKHKSKDKVELLPSNCATGAVGVQDQSRMHSREILTGRCSLGMGHIRLTEPRSSRKIVPRRSNAKRRGKSRPVHGLRQEY